jgi:hypothetical protein
MEVHSIRDDVRQADGPDYRIVLSGKDRTIGNPSRPFPTIRRRKAFQFRARGLPDRAKDFSPIGSAITDCIGRPLAPAVSG